MSDTYNYEDGAIHHDYKKVLHIEHVDASDLDKLVKTFLRNEAEDAEMLEEVNDAHIPAPTQELVSTELNEKLVSEEAIRYWERLQEAGFVDSAFQLMKDTTRKQTMYIAELFAERLGIKSKWKTFEQLWGISNLAQEKWDMQATGTPPSRSKEIDKIFAD